MITQYQLDDKSLSGCCYTYRDIVWSYLYDHSCLQFCNALLFYITRIYLALSASLSDWLWLADSRLDVVIAVHICVACVRTRRSHGDKSNEFVPRTVPLAPIWELVGRMDKLGGRWILCAQWLKTMSKRQNGWPSSNKGCLAPKVPTASGALRVRGDVRAINNNCRNSSVAAASVYCFLIRFLIGFIEQADLGIFVA